MFRSVLQVKLVQLKKPPGFGLTGGELIRRTRRRFAFRKKKKRNRPKPKRKTLNHRAASLLLLPTRILFCSTLPPLLDDRRPSLLCSTIGDPPSSARRPAIVSGTGTRAPPLLKKNTSGDPPSSARRAAILPPLLDDRPSSPAPARAPLPC
ncbi:unnamed protein product [Linum trigynum]|uniref:Uncharacterized protein n=1 Tax=Linum trigynum TaxID=586398 RepID=A0AAV2CHT9_9ROSI